MKLARDILIKLIGALIIVALFGLLLRSCEARRNQAAQSRVDRSQAGAASDSAADAIGTQGNVNDRAAQSEDLSRSNAKDIRDAEGANAPVTAASRDAAFRSMCKRPSFRSNPANDVRCATARVLEEASGGAGVPGKR